ncbi:concanavalin A-like lectin/glucanase domain-containing protein [Fomes fomentarius]|nr:concanavalin A-like lectin/glucanase domain-containing protein [Fomes fomentarius]
MRPHLPLLVLFLVNATPSEAEAGLPARSTESVVGTANRLHRRAAKHSATLVEDIRRAFWGMYAQKFVATTGGSQRAYCINNANSGNLGGSARGSNGTSNGTSRLIPSSTSAQTGESSATSTTTEQSPTSTDAKPTSSPLNSSWRLVKSYQGDSFFDDWDFFTFDDPTHGIVEFVDRSTAQSSSLIGINNAGRAIMRVDTTPQVSGNRRSVRITTEFTYTGGLVLLDTVHIPTGCGTWPAFWSNGASGEIDILEGVNDYANNQATIHTAHGCTLPSSDNSALGITGTVVGGTNCAAAESGNSGCGMVATMNNTYGTGFNNNGGGVYAMRWVDSGISVWFFQRNDIPLDISSDAPLPDQWGTPMAFWPATDCDTSTFFKSHSLIFDTTFCGDWAGNVWSSAGAPGQEQSCAARVGVSTCEEYVRNHGSAFQDAYWEVNYVKVFQ